ncbi:DUF2987 domain-containing protein [Shewanella sp. Isolate11]|uniref:DUF2987 domain-containing protein n=1 Tax=Shewanella sp. Isolate11 TaxID=2908530 RepID=UPI001EFE1EB0|nr:DUF2987 domain-containing protein [Shewanella sp. Isolate11]MCG9696668.1 DUF2987 domain-containing protein [Shewanella sp. Isolate11]
MHRVIIAVLLLGSSFITTAAPISLEYQGFYARLKTLNAGHFPLVDIAFSVPKQNGCLIETGYISTEKERFPLVITEQQRIFIPFDDTLKSERALINLQMQDDAQQCGIAMQIRAKQTQQIYQQAELIALKADMNNLLNKLQGFPMRYFSADIDGISFQFEDSASVIIDGKQQQTNHQFSLSSDQIELLSELKFSVQPIVVSPWIKP